MFNTNQKRVIVFILIGFLFLAPVIGMTSFVYATSGEDTSVTELKSAKHRRDTVPLSVGLPVALVGFGVAIAMGLAIHSAISSYARNPALSSAEVFGNIRQLLIIGLAMLESLVIYALLVFVLFYMY